MLCTVCKKEIANDAVFCTYCGKSVTLKCSACGSDVPIGGIFCPKCGFNTSNKELAESQAIAEQEAIKKQVSTVTYLSVDVVSSTELISKEDAEKARELLESALQLMIESVTEYYGKVFKTAGDGMLAYFVGELHGLRGCFAAAKMQKDCVNSKMPVSIRVGLYSTVIDGLDKATIENSNEIKLSQALEHNAPEQAIQISEELYEENRDYLLVSSKKNISIEDRLLLLPSYTLKNITSESANLINKVLAQLKVEQQQKEVSATGEIEGERKYITSVFIQLKGLHQVEEKDIIKMVKKMIERFEGTWIKQLDETIFAIFGAPVTLEDHALRATLACYLMLQNILEEKLPVDIRIGINSGEAVIDEIGSNEYRQYDALGSSVSLAARMMQTAGSNQIQISQETFSLVEKTIQVIPLGKKQIKGFDDLVETYSLTGLNRENIRRRMNSQYYANKNYIGRDHVLEIFSKIWQKVNAGVGQILAVKAEPGVGKTRFLYECSQKALSNDSLVFTVAASAYETNISYATLKQFLQVVFTVDSSGISQFQLAQLKARLKHISFSNDLAEASLISMLGKHVDNPKWIGLTPILQQKILFQSTWEVLKYLNESSVVIIAFEDLQWCDNASLAFIEFIATQIEAHKMLLMLNYRPEFHFSPVIGSLTSEVILNPLTEEESLTLIKLSLPGGESLKILYDIILKNTLGNPFFIEEYIKSVIEQGGVKLENSGYVINKDLNLNKLPTTIQGVIGGRIDRLPENEKKLLQQASILGISFRLLLLRYVSQLNPLDLQTLLQSLEKQGFFILKTLIPEPEYSFSHAHLREVTYNSMLQKTKIIYHTQLVEEIELNEVSHLNRFYWLLSQHCYQAKLWEKALIYYKKLVPSESSLDYTPQQAVTLLPNIKHCFEQIEEERRPVCFDTYAVAISIIVHRMFILLKDTDESTKLINEMIILAKKYNNKVCLTVFKGWLVSYCFVTGATQQSYQLIPEVIQLLEQSKKNLNATEARDLTLMIYTWGFHPIWFLGYFNEFDKYVDMIFKLSEGLPFDYSSEYSIVSIVAVTTVHFFWCNHLRARVQVMREKVTEINAIIENLPDAEPLLLARFSKAVYAFTVGDFQQANDELNKIEKIAVNIHHFFLIYAINIFRSITYYLLNDRENALVKARLLKHDFDLMKLPLSSPFIFYFPKALALCGEFDDAISVLEAILNRAEREQEKPLMAGCYRVKALTLNLMAKDNQYDKEIEDNLEKSQKITDEIHCNLQNPLIQIVYSDYYKRLNQPDKQQQHHQRALEYFKEYEMEGWYKYYIILDQNQLQ